VILGYLLLILVPVAAIAYIVWDHKRKIAERDAVSASRLQEMLGAVAQPSAAPESAQSAAKTAHPAVKSTQPAVNTAAPATPVLPAVATASLCASRDRVLTPPQTLLYYLLRTGLPDHVVFARVTLASLLDAAPGLSGFAREEQMRRLAALTVDFAVSDKSMKPLAVVQLASREDGSAAQADRESARSRVIAAGVRYVELEATQLPRKDAIRELVIGAESPSDDSARAAAAGA